ncbi:hypothetical protein F2Q69_00013307 [Brassica cretica]|uniref:Uncharacterized protein n=1 Tax=Brassica cretica TaxID=69181 RepID=A0A8S9R4Z3_BRACR|nr:hypothetical protein F2Q69_00013307 [Brassica cretica]
MSCVNLFEGLEKEEGHLKTTHHNNIVQLLYSFQEKSIDSLLASEVPIGYQAGTFTLEDLTYSLGMARSRRLREILHRL